MKQTKTLIVLAAIAACAGSFYAGRMSNRQAGGSAIPAENPSPGGGRGAAPSHETAPVRTDADNPAFCNRKSGADAKVHEMKVLDFDIENSGGKAVIEIRLSQRPDIDDARRRLKVAEAGGGAGIPVKTTYFQRASYWDEAKRQLHYLRIEGDMPFRKALELRIDAGLACADAANAKSNEVFYTMQKAYVHAFKRPDERPWLDFASSGRYLAPAGDRLVEFESMNNSNASVRVSKAHAENIVAMLALEEDAYEHIGKRYWGAEEAYAGDLSTELWKKDFKMANRTNAEEKHAFRPAESNGTYFVELEGDKSRRKCKVVCITDIGLTVREDAKGATVWAVSLTSGRPLAGARIEAYSSANARVASATTDAQGVARLAAENPQDRKNGIFAIVATAAGGGDMSFIALGEKSRNNDKIEDRWRREAFLEAGDLCAYAWTDRGIYRHGEKILFSAIVRNGDGVAPAPAPFELRLAAPDGTVRDKAAVKSDAAGVVSHDGFSVGESLPGGPWTVSLSTPGGEGGALAKQNVKIEEFAPPHIRVKAKAAADRAARNFKFEASAEHLYGAPAAGLACEGAVSFEDCGFAPGGEWKEWRFGDGRKEPLTVFRRLGRKTLGDGGACTFDAAFTTNDPPPRAAILARVNAAVFEDGGRPAYAKDEAVLHFYGLYAGAKLPKTLQTGGKKVSVPVALVAPDGGCAGGARKMAAKLERIDTVCTYVEKSDGYASWTTERVRKTVAENIEAATGADGRGALELPEMPDGDYALTIECGDGVAAFSQTFYATSEAGDGEVRASLLTPDETTVEPDRKFYAPGEKPRLAVRAPFAGVALVTVMREGVEYCRAVDFPNPTGTIELDAVTAAQAPNLDVAVEVVQSAVKASGAKMAAKASGAATVRIRRPEDEIAVKAKTSFAKGKLKVEIDAPGADEVEAIAVDAAIDILAGGTPGYDPAGHFAQDRIGGCVRYDLYGRLLPFVGDAALKASGVKTGGGDDALMSRVSPVATRRFKPLAMRKTRIPVKDGKASAEFDTGEFAGEVRVSAVAAGRRATGAATTACKAVPNLVMQPDAPRFAAPGDRFEATLPLANTTKEAGEVEYSVEPGIANGRISLAPGERKVLVFAATAPDAPGEMEIAFKASGFGEEHADAILLPVRPAAPWRETAGAAAIEPGASMELPRAAPPARFSYKTSGSKLEELRSALEWLAEYPHGCLEQTVSRIYPLVAAGGMLETLGSIEAVNREEYIAAGVKRIKSMWHPSPSWDDNGKSFFSMWPDCDEPAHDVEVQIYAAMFLAEAGAAGSGAGGADAMPAGCLEMLARHARESTNDCTAAYACVALAAMDAPELDAMFKLYAKRDSLDELALARLARAYARFGDRKRAKTLLDAVKAPSTSLKLAAETLLAALDADDDGARADSLVLAVEKLRGSDFTWGTTADNAAALVALGEYWRRKPGKPGRPETVERDGRLFNTGKGTAFVSWRKKELPPPGETPQDVAQGISVKREYLDAGGRPLDMKAAKCGALVIARITLSTDRDRTLSDLVIDDPFPAALEPVTGPAADEATKQTPDGWTLHVETRDDRKLVYSDRFELKKGEEAVYVYPLRVVSAGDFAVPQVAVEAMYDTGLRARSGGGRIVSVR